MTEAIQPPPAVPTIAVPPAPAPPAPSHLRWTIIAGLLFLILFIVSSLLGYMMLSKKTVNTSAVVRPTVSVPTPTVAMTEKYDNPFDAKSQYENPFAQSANPFDVLAQ